MRYSANLGFLWADLALPKAVRAAAKAGFDAVEIHAPDVPAAELRTVLERTGLPLLSLNTTRGPEGAFGLAALPGRNMAAREAIDAAVDYAAEVGAQNVHVLAGLAHGTAGHRHFIDNLSYASARAAPHGIGILIEPINAHDVPGYFLTHTEQALEIIDEVGAKNLKMLFDCYHVQRTEGDLCTRLAACLPKIGHIQFAGVPDRGRPDRGELNYAYVFACLRELGWSQPLGAEYRPEGKVEDGLEWMTALAPEDVATEDVAQGGAD
ncbi:hydroxypyruvate isomerase family protein [Rhodalgimonas zhirmunskyi]|uniref:TIM barrel protein n=1 Tax=Rhodalgimonas zhirmunskyi TaxID=2964767 RepID=A0AAJ1UCJ4_9RHOB|nr:TIM barrel protein [Rhodoalgimonas zhirmunskyi]MDQ2093662.1 TIM barrel protein [Rhodoalgimonas zhirmunskyi]